MYVDFAPLIQRLEQYWAELKVSTFQGRHIEIPVIYGAVCFFVCIWTYTFCKKEISVL